MKDHEHPFFRPLWRRVAIVVACAAWSIFEFSTGATMWGTIAGAFAAYSAWQFLFLYKEPTGEPVGEPTGEPPASSGASGSGAPENKE